jgi:RNA polymerase sigma-70 factor (ECF subfamily)
MKNLLSDQELARRTGRGDHSALDQLYQRYAGRVEFYCFKLLGDKEKAQDIVHDIFLKFIEKPELFNPEMQFSTWIFSCAYNACKNEFRRRENHALPDMNADEISAGQHSQYIDPADHGLMKELLDKGLQELNPEIRAVFLLRYMNGHALSEISGMMNIPEGTVKSRLHNAVHTIAKKLKIFSPQNSRD